jgi:hypothetical protein
MIRRQKKAGLGENQFVISRLRQSTSGHEMPEKTRRGVQIRMYGVGDGGWFIDPLLDEIRDSQRGSHPNRISSDIIFHKKGEEFITRQKTGKG